MASTRRIVMFNRVSADGYFAGPDGNLEWVVPEQELDKAAAGSLSGADTILFGRRTYELFEGFWPHALDDSPTAPDPHGAGRSLLCSSRRDEDSDLSHVGRQVNHLRQVADRSTVREWA